MTRALRVAAVALAVVALTGCASSGRTFGRWVDDTTITARVKKRLFALETRPSTHISVDTYHGTVYLSGVVESEAMKQRAQLIASGVPDVEQVVTNLEVKPETAEGAALPRPDAAAPPVVVTAHPLLELLPGLRRLEPFDAGGPGRPLVAYDAEGRRVATVYLRPMIDLVDGGMNDLRSAGPIDHVSILPVAPSMDVPEQFVCVVLWHVTAADAAKLAAPARRR
jgi:hypothetical protein